MEELDFKILKVLNVASFDGTKNKKEALKQVRTLKRSLKIWELFLACLIKRKMLKDISVFSLSQLFTVELIEMQN